LIKFQCFFLLIYFIPLLTDSWLITSGRIAERHKLYCHLWLPFACRTSNRSTTGVSIE
jgi:hypothetical protein